MICDISIVIFVSNLRNSINNLYGIYNYNHTWVSLGSGLEESFNACLLTAEVLIWLHSSHDPSER